MLVVLAGFLLIVMLIGGLQSCSALVGAAGGGVAASSYQSEDADILAAEAAYCALEAELQEYLDTYERTHDYDEYHYDLDEIKHDPYVLASILSALHDGAWTASEVQGTLQMLFEKQYILTETVVTEVRYRTVTRTDSEGSNILMGGFLTAVERPVGAICISVGRGLAFQATALLALAFTVGGSAIWYAPVISEAVCAVMAVWFLRRFLRS